MRNGYPIFKRAGVIGAGIMGSQIAAILAGAGLEVELLDIVPPDGPSASPERSAADFRNRLALGGLARLKSMKPPALYVAGDLKLIRPGNLDDHIERLKTCDWVIEAVVERLEVKRALYARIGPALGAEAILSSNTSGLLWRQLAEGMGDALSRRFMITHFFNPPRHMKLLEIVAPEGADPRARDAVAAFARERLGKGVVFAKDTPAFVANRIGIFQVMDVIHRVVEQGWPIEAVDAVMGRPTSRPKSGIFRTLDMVGIDTLTYLAAELIKGCPDDEGIERIRIPQFLQQMVVKGMTGDKGGRGFYIKDRATGQISALDPATLEHRPRITFSTPSLKAAARIGDPAERARAIVFSNDQAGEIAWPSVSAMLVYAANRIPEIAGTPLVADRAMRWGYNWELGPFEMWDALGVREVVDRLEKEGREAPQIVQKLLKAGHTRFYEWRGHRRACFDPARGAHEPEEGGEERVSIARLKAVGRVVEENAGASLVDLGDGAFACEFHTKMNSVDEDVIKMLHASLERVEREGAGLLIANEGEQFSVGANLLLILVAAQQGRWGEIETMVREFQSANERIRFCHKPVIAVPFGMALGGGCEVCLAAARRVASAEAYMGLVEAGAGLIPAGGGCKNLLLMLEARARERIGREDPLGGKGGRMGWPDRPPASRGTGGPQPIVNAAFELIGRAWVSGSAREAMEAGFLAAGDHIVMDREILISEAKRALVALGRGYALPTVRADITLPGRGGEAALTNGVRSLVALGKATAHDALIARRLARVLAGGDVPTIHRATEAHILDLEREAFLSLVGEEKTQARMAHLLKTGKPLRN